MLDLACLRRGRLGFVTLCGICCPALSLLVLAAAASGQSLVRDINPATVNASGSSSPGAGGHFWFNGVAVFPASDTAHGRELWRSDGSASGTYLLKDIHPGAQSSDPTAFCTIGGRLYFAADDGRNGEELWITDGTAAGTELVADVRPGAEGSMPRGLASGFEDGQSFLFFSADDGTHGREPWHLVTPGAPVLSADVRPGATSSMTASVGFWFAYHTVASRMHFPADDGVHGEELWFVAPTLTPRIGLVRDFNPGRAGSSPRNVNDDPFEQGFELLTLDDGAVGRELWAHQMGIYSLVANIGEQGSSSNPSRALRIGASPHHLVFAATSQLHGRELWRATIVPFQAGGWTVSLLKDIEPGTESSNPTPIGATARLYSSATDVLFAATTSASGSELWTTDASPRGTTLIELVPGALGSNPTPLGYYHPNSGTGYVVFAADNGSDGIEPWVSNGTVSGTFPLSVVAGAAGSFPTPVATADARVLFAATHPVHGTELWQTDGTAAGATLVRDIRPPTAHGNPREIVAIDGTGLALFQGDDGVIGRELWISDSTSAGTNLLLDLAPGAASSEPRHLFHHQGRVYFSADDGVIGRELWVSDGTSAGTHLVKDIALGVAHADPGPFAARGGVVYFAAEDAGAGRELWRTDGTSAGTMRVADLVAGPGSSYPRGFAATRTMLCFTATTALGAELWRTAGTAAATAMVKDIFAGPGSSAPGSDPTIGAHAPHVAGDVLYFGARESFATGVELFRSDGTAAGTFLVRDIDAGGSDSSPADFASVGGRVVFAATTTQLGREAWASDGTLAGTIPILEAAPGAPSGDPSGFTRVGNHVLFAVNRQGSSGRELWRTQGSPGTTELVRDLHPGLGDGVLPASRFDATWLVTLPGIDHVYFPATDGASGIELWRSDGTSRGTARVADLGSGARGSFPGVPVRVGSSLLFAAEGGGLGAELWRVDAPATFQTFGLGCAGSAGVPQLAANDAPRLGNQGFRVLLGDARGHSVAALLLGAPAQPLPVGGCTVYFDLLGPQLVFSAPTDAGGAASFAMPVSSERSLLGARLIGQAVVVDATGALFGVLAASDAIELVLGA